MVSSSSTKRAARLAQKGKGKKVRFQGGTLFPLVVLGVLVVGLATIVYGRQSRPSADASPPTIDDHWHAAYGFQLCDQEEVVQLAGDKEETDATGQLISREYLRTGVHSHDDGVIHWHALTSAAVGKRAKLGLFLDVYGVELDDDSLRFPADQGGREYVEGETTCDGDDGELRVVVWDNFSDEGSGKTYVSDFDDIRIDRDGMVFTIAFVARGVDVEKPPWAEDLPTLGAADTAPSPDQFPTGTDVITPGTATPAAGTAVPATGTDAPASPAATAPAATAPPGTDPAPAATG